MRSGNLSADRIEAKDALSRRPLLSVIMPAYNVAGYIGEALESVLAQTFTDYEIIIVNDGSPDTNELERVIEPFLDRIIYLKQENGGPSRARNTAIMKARGEYVGFLDADDMWNPNFLAEQLKVLRENPALDLVYADSLMFGESALAGQTYMQVVPSTGPVTFESLLSEQCGVITSCVVARRQALIDVGLFDEKFIRSEDFDLWLRLAHHGKQLTYQRQVLARRRLHGGSLAADRTRLIEGQIAVMQKLALQLAPLTPSTRDLMKSEIDKCQAQLDIERGKQQLAAGQYQQATEAIMLANNFYRSRKLQAVLIGLRVAPGLLRRAYELSR